MNNRAPSSGSPRFRPAAALILSALLFLPAPLRAQQGRMLDTRDTVLEWAWLDRIGRGVNIPTTVQTISAAEAASYGVDTGAAACSEPLVSGRLSVQPFLLGWSGLDSGRWKGDNQERLTDGSYLTRFRLDNPILDLGLSFGSDAFYGTTQINFGTDSHAYYAGESGLSGIWSTDDYIGKWTFPDTGYLSWSDRHLTLAAGRLRAGIGLGEANILLNGQARWYDQAQFAWWSGKLRFYGFWGTSSTHLDDDEYAVQSCNWDTINNHDASTASLVPYKFFSYHRVEYKPFRAAGFGLSEMQLVGGKVPDLLNILPGAYWHNTYTAGVSNVMLHADAWTVPFPGFLLRGEFLMDDSKAPYEDREAKPNCWAWELGARYVLPVAGRDWRFAFDAEYSHADRWTYDRWQPWLTMYQRQLLTGGYRGFDIALGHPDGGDVNQYGLSFVALAKSGRRLEAGYTLTDKGPVYLGRYWKGTGKDLDGDGSPDEVIIPVYYDFDDWYESLVGDGKLTLAGLLGSTRTWTQAFSLKAVWPLGPRWEANAEIDFRYIRNAEHVEGNTATETVWKTGLTWTIGGR